MLAHAVATAQQNPADYLFLLTKGRARFFFIAEDGKKIILHWLTPGEIFGAATLAPNPTSYLVSTEMAMDSSVLSWDRATIRNLADRYPRLWENTISVGTDYLTLYLAAHIAMTCQDARKRLAQILINLARGIGERVAGGVMLDATNEELASAANVTLFTVSRLMSEWARQGIIAKSRGKVLLRSPERLLQSL
jgi:CRP-like cAMP-binding protein